MRRERIDLGDIGHGRGERRSDRTTGADEVTIFVSFFNNAVRNVISDGIAVANNTFELLIKALFDNGIRIIAIVFAKVVVADFLNAFRRIRKVGVGRENIRLHRLNWLNQVGDGIGILDDDFASLVFWQPFHEGIKHLFGRTEMLVGVREERKFVAEIGVHRVTVVAYGLLGHDVNIPADFVFRVDVMAVARRHNRFMKFISRADNIL